MTDAPTFRASAPGPVPDYVRAGETLLWKARPTLLLLLSHVVGLLFSFIVFGFFVAGAVARGGGTIAAVLPIFIVALFVLVLGLSGLRIKRTEYAVTNRAVYTRSGIIGRTIIQTTFDKITDIALKQDVIGRLFGYASLHVNTAGSNTAPVRMDGLRDAEAVKDRVEQARDGLLRREPDAPARVTIPRFVPDRLLMRLRCPTTKLAFKRPQQEAGTRVPCPHCGKTHLATEVKLGRGGPA